MLKFYFTFNYQGQYYDAECQPFPLNGTTDLHITPLDSELFNRFGTKILAREQDGTISTTIQAGSQEGDYISALAEGIVAYFDDQAKTINQ